jgi:Mg-chelatase subunit ChlD
MNDKLVKPDEQSGISLSKGKLTSRGSPFQQRVNEAKRSEVDPSTMPNRICLMLDKSSSMSTTETKGARRIDLLKDALCNFVGRCDFKNTAIAIETFPEGFELPLSSNLSVLQTAGFGIEASGNTPMRACVERSLSKIPMTRGVIVSDGEATDWYSRPWHDDDETSETAVKADELLKKYKEAGIPIDCVHIASDSGGEALLRRIAEVTGGIYLKFTDVSAFANSFGYLTPGFRATLTDGRVSARDLGAREVL